MSSINFETALLYPFRGPNRTRLVWIPGAAVLLLQLLSFGIGLVSGLIERAMLDGADADSAVRVLFQLGTQGVASIVGFVISLPLVGYLWRLVSQWRSGKENDPPPDWLTGGYVWGCMLDGLKVMLYHIPASLLGFLPMLLTFIVVAVFFIAGYNLLSDLQTGGYIMGVLVVLASVFVTLAFGFFIAPFLFAPLVLSAQSRKLSDLFNLPRAWKMALQHYNTALKATGWMIATSLLLLVAAMLLMCTCVGILLIPFLQFPQMVIMAHLANQVFPLEESLHSEGDSSLRSQ